MRMFLKLSSALIMFILFHINSSLFAQKLDDFIPAFRDAKTTDLMKNSVEDNFQFNGYTNYWHDVYDRWVRYGNLFKIVVPNVEASIAQSKVDIAEDMGIPGLSMQEGFMNGLISESFTVLDQPSVQQIEQSLQKGNVLVLLDPDSESGKKISGKYSGSGIMQASHQLGAKDLIKVNAFYLEKDRKKLFVISSPDNAVRNKVRGLIDNTIGVVKDYDLHRGWFGQSTLFRTDTCSALHRIEVISKGMNEGNDWFIFDGPKEYLAKKEIEDMIANVGLQVVTDVGYSPVYGCKDYDGLDTSWGDSALIKFAHERGGYIFHQVADTALNYDGFMAGEGNKKQIDNEEVPFISASGGQGGRRQAFTNPENDNMPTMILFVKKGTKFTRETLWKSIMSRKEIAVLGQGKMMGPALYRNTLNMLALDREFIEEYYGDRINIEAVMDGNQLKINFTNTSSRPVSGNLKIGLPTDIKIEGGTSQKVDLPANGKKTVKFKLMASANTLSNFNPIAIHYNWGSSNKSTIAVPDISQTKVAAIN